MKTKDTYGDEKETRDTIREFLEVYKENSPREVYSDCRELGPLGRTLYRAVTKKDSPKQRIRKRIQALEGISEGSQLWTRPRVGEFVFWSAVEPEYWKIVEEIEEEVLGRRLARDYHRLKEDWEGK